MKDLRIYLFAGLVVSVIIIFYLVDKNKEQTEEAKFYKKRYERHVRTIDSLRQRLSRSNQLRDSLIHSSTALYNDYQDILRRDSLKTVEIDRLKGKYNNLNSKQLEGEMIKRYERETIHP